MAVSLVIETTRWGAREQTYWNIGRRPKSAMNVVREMRRTRERSCVKWDMCAGARGVEDEVLHAVEG